MLVVRPVRDDDFERLNEALYGAPTRVRPRVRGFTGLLDDRIIGIGGIALHANGTREAFCDLTDEAHKFPVSLHKAARTTLAMAAQLGVKRIVATAWDGHPAAARWLLRLGFEPMMIDGVAVYVLDL